MIVVTIDGPSGAGKSSTSKLVAQRAGWNYLDTGALYRAVAWLALREKVSSADQILSALANNMIHFIADPKKPKVFVGDVDVTTEIRTERVTESVSVISALPEIRAALLNLQRRIINEAERGIVVEGRDIGTVVALSLIHI